MYIYKTLNNRHASVGVHREMNPPGLFMQGTPGGRIIRCAPTDFQCTLTKRPNNRHASVGVHREMNPPGLFMQGTPGGRIIRCAPTDFQCTLTKRPNNRHASVGAYRKISPLKLLKKRNPWRAHRRYALGRPYRFVQYESYLWFIVLEPDERLSNHRDFQRNLPKTREKTRYFQF